MRNPIVAAVCAALFVSAASANATLIRDHMQCRRIKDPETKAVYTADLTGANPYFPQIVPGCKIRVPAKWLCVDVAKTNVVPAPPGSPPGQPAQSYLCYNAMCNKVQTTIPVKDQFGAREVTVGRTGMLCAPIVTAGENASCTDGIKNGNETGKDCGGGCPPCPDGAGCNVSVDCQSGVCSSGICAPAGPSCSNGIKDGSETGKDCGANCPPCPDGIHCNVNGDCQSGICDNMGSGSTFVCLPSSTPPSCSDGIKNGNETGKDCGGGTCPPCLDGFGCNGNGDCQSNVCSGGICVPPGVNCFNGIKDGNETGKDCGGSCPPCPDGVHCNVNGDCQSGVCDNMASGGTFVCLPSPNPLYCTDGIQDGNETGKDCGGSCPPCPNGIGCNGNGDCQSGFCSGGMCVPVGLSCTDGIQDGNETGKDCGGSCPACPNGIGCNGNGDCQSGVCSGGICVPVGSSCTDGVKDNDETGKDCGGSCPPCPDGIGCNGNGDCQSGVCSGGICVPVGSNCTDGIKDSDETGKDCGGSCPPCPNGIGCNGNGDCQSGVCSGGICVPVGSTIYCGHPADCPSGYFCGAAGTCRLGPCDHCIYGYTCGTDGSCQGVTNACDKESDCASDSLCIASATGGGVCTSAANQCFDQVQCGTGENCVAGKCTLSCTSDASCRDGFNCDISRGVCTVTVKSCTATEDCLSPTLVCVGGACVPRSGPFGSCTTAGDVWTENGCIPNQAATFTCVNDGVQDTCEAGSICLRRDCWISCDPPNQNACSSQPVFNECKPLADGSSTYNVCGSAQNLGSQCGPGSAGNASCIGGSVCIDGFCK